MNLFQNPYVVGALGVAAILLVGRNALGPVWSRIAHRMLAPAQAPAPVVAAPATITPEAPPAAEVLVVKPPPRVPPAAKIDLAQVGWKANSSPHRDPFQVTPATITNLARLYPAASEALRLQAIWWQSGSILASVDGRVVHEGDVIYPTNCTVTFTVARIGAERIWLDGPGGSEILMFDPTASLAGVSVNLSKDIDQSFLGPKTQLDWPYRVVNGQTNDVHRTPGWESFSGKVISKMDQGKYRIHDTASDRILILKGIPLDLVDDDSLPEVRCKYVSTESYTASATNSNRTVRVYDFGQPSSPPHSIIEALKMEKARLIAQYDRMLQQKVEGEVQRAKGGSPSAQYMLGRRYLYGDGVGKDPQAARAWFEASAAQGNPDARAMLSSLAGQ